MKQATLIQKIENAKKEKSEGVFLIIIGLLFAIIGSFSLLIIVGLIGVLLGIIIGVGCIVAGLIKESITVSRINDLEAELEE
jgi:amino acid permease